MGMPVDRWKGVVPAWIGIVAAWGGLVVLAMLLAPDRLAVALPATSITALATGAAITRRLLARNQPPLIRPMDLRRG